MSIVIGSARVEGPTLVRSFGYVRAPEVLDVEVYDDGEVVVVTRGKVDDETRAGLLDRCKFFNIAEGRRAVSD